ncbi:MAG: sugar transferase [Butyrivibrio sp.]|nr:sugar transferase [Butyrivibrio sp.]
MNRSNAGASFDSVHIILDVFILAISFIISFSIWGDTVDRGLQLRAFMAVYLVCIIIFLLCNRTANIYNNTIFYYLDRIIRRETASFLAAVICGVLLVLNISDEIGQAWKFFVGIACVSYGLIFLEIIFFRNIIDRIIMRRHVPRVLYVGSKDSYNKFRYFLKKTSLIVNEIGYISFDDDDSIEYIGKLKDLENIIRKYNIDQVYILQKREMDIPYLQKYIDICIEMGVTCRVIIDIFRRRKSYSYVSSIGTYPVFTFHTVTMNNMQKVIKRIFDIFFSIFAIVITSPIMIITAIAIKIDSPGPAIFKQVRVGKNGRHFKIWKFRSMYQNADDMKAELQALNQVKDGMMFKIKDDPRITKVGKFIRKTSIDELPQFFNVLAGSMSVVGTRPPTIDEVEKYSMHQWRRISIKPGITGMWQANGRSSITDFNQVVELDTEYIDQWSMWLDIKLLFKTVSEVFGHKNSY